MGFAGDDGEVVCGVYEEGCDFQAGEVGGGGEGQVGGGVSVLVGGCVGTC